MKFVIDMNLSPQWISVFEEQGWESCHWSDQHDPRAADIEIMTWARTHLHIVFRHDLDFGALLASTNADGPSVIQVRTQDVSPHYLGVRMVEILTRFSH